MHFSHLNLSPFLFLLVAKSSIAEDSSWRGNTEVDAASEQTISHLDGSIATSIPGGDQVSLDPPVLVAETAPLIASDAACSFPKENSQRKKKLRRGGLPNDACAAPMQASPATEKKPTTGFGDPKTKPNSGVPGNQRPAHGGPLFESGSWSAPWTLRSDNERCPDPLFKLPVCAFDDDIAWIGIPLDLAVVYPHVHPCRPSGTRPWCCAFVLDNVMTLQEGQLVATTTSSGMECIPMYSDMNPRLPASSP